jgi:hypothetical protein
MTIEEMGRANEGLAEEMERLKEECDAMAKEVALSQVPQREKKTNEETRKKLACIWCFLFCLCLTNSLSLSFFFSFRSVGPVPEADGTDCLDDGKSVRQEWVAHRPAQQCARVGHHRRRPVQQGALVRRT